jgi:tetratricopeptide (TPR) repeat protein
MKFRFRIVVCVLVLFLVGLSSCGPNTKVIRRMQMMEEGVDSPTTVEELTAAIAKFQNRIEDLVTAETRVGLWYKILGIRYLDNGMYGKALECFKSALGYYPSNQNLYYYVGVCAGYMAKASLDFDVDGKTPDKQQYYDLSESSYLRAIELDKNYVRALYGVSVLYVFELNEPEKAIPFLERIMEIETKDLDAMTILARAYYQTGAIEESVALYDKLIAGTTEPKRKAELIANKETVLNSAYERK